MIKNKIFDIIMKRIVIYMIVFCVSLMFTLFNKLFKIMVVKYMKNEQTCI